MSAQKLLIAHAPGETAQAELLAAPLREAGYDVIHEGTILIGESVVAEFSKQLAAGVPVILCATVKAMGTRWGRRVVNAVRRHPGAKIFIMQMEREADVESVSFDERVARHWEDPGKAMSDLCAALERQLAPPRPSGPVERPAPLTIDRLPTVPGEFFGREAELQLLNRALKPDSPTRIIQFIAAGGTGKTKLLRHWLDRPATRAATPNRIVWSFYSQGTTESKQVSASLLFDEAFKAFGVDQSRFNTDEERADALVDRLSQHHCLLVLDGLEPMQQAGRGSDGRLKERAMARLLKRLIDQTNSLCIITTRIAVHDIRDRSAVISHDLDNLSTADGIRLLHSFDIQAPAQQIPQQLQPLVEKVGGHALTLHLLGNAIKTHLFGDARRLDTLLALVDDYDAQGRHAFSVMRAYENWLTDDQGQPTAELQLLYLLGLFDHPIEIDVLELLVKEGIPNLTAPKLTFWQRLFKRKASQQVDLRKWRTAIANLRDKYHLLSQHSGPDQEIDRAAQAHGLLDCHPLIREWFGNKLKTCQPQAWQQAHARLYDFYKKLPDKEQPDTLEAMRPLLKAVAHGCAAGLHQQALDEVYWPRIRRGGEAYIVKKLGAFSDDLAAVAHFFDTPWQTPVAELTPLWQGGVLNWAGFHLRALGRLREALEPMRASIEMAAVQENWINAAKGAGNLSELQLTLGEVPDALHSGKRAVDYADQSEDMFHRMHTRTTQADALHQAGQEAEALTLFAEAEQLQEEWQPAYPRLYSLWGFRYCDLLLAQAEGDAQRLEEVLAWADYAWKISQTQLGLLSQALDQLTLARTHLQQQNLPQAAHWLEQAVAGLRAAGQEQYLPLGLLTRAALHRLNQDYALAQQDLQEVHDIATQGEMKLHLTDYHLETARLALAQADPASARQQLQKGARLIEATGYHRRDPELADLQARLPS